MIGNIIKNMRVSKGLSQKELGEQLNMSDTTISSYERENSQPDFKTIVKIANKCDYDIVFIDRKRNIKMTVDDMSKEDVFMKKNKNRQ